MTTNKIYSAKTWQPHAVRFHVRPHYPHSVMCTITARVPGVPGLCYLQDRYAYRADVQRTKQVMLVSLQNMLDALEIREAEGARHV